MNTIASFFATLYIILLCVITGGMLLVLGGINSESEGPWHVGIADDRSIFRVILKGLNPIRIFLKKKIKVKKDNKKD